jgi:hypothetical protein
MDAINIPKESIKTVWNLVENDITKALIRSAAMLILITLNNNV